MLCAIAIFCDPPAQRQLLANHKMLNSLQVDPRVKMAFGLHPKKVNAVMDGYVLSHEFLQNLTQLLSLESTVAFGEVGLDNTVAADRYQAQEDALVDVLRSVRPILLNRGLPVVIHSRQGRADRQVLPIIMDILEEQLGNDHPIQVHYFNGSVEDVRTWLRRFSNVVFSIPVCSRVSSAAALREIPIEQMLLETDAPYGDSNQLSSPLDISRKCSTLANVLGMSEHQLLVRTALNAIRFFGISPSDFMLQGKRSRTQRH